MSDFDSLVTALEGWFEKPLCELPDELRQRVMDDFFPLRWDDLTPDQRRSAAYQWDYQIDPTKGQDRESRWNFFARKIAIEQKIEEWEKIATPTATDLAQREAHLAELRENLARIERQEQQAPRDYPERHRLDHDVPKPSASDSSARFIAYPKALKLLADRLDATQAEMAAWVWLGTEDGGLAAYLNANELNRPSRFHYSPGSGDDFDYLSPLKGCWFQEKEILAFDPADRYITGKSLIERWSTQPHIQPEAFIRAMIAEAWLFDIHPICNVTQGSNPNDFRYPPLTTALFNLSHVEAIEAEDFGMDHPDRSAKPRGHLNHDPELQDRANQIAAERKAATGRSITRKKVGQILAKELSMDEATVTRRIRKQWK